MKTIDFRNHTVVVFVPSSAPFFGFDVNGVLRPVLHGLHVFPIADESPAAVVLHAFVTQVARHCFHEIEREDIVFFVAV